MRVSKTGVYRGWRGIKGEVFCLHVQAKHLRDSCSQLFDNSFVERRHAMQRTLPIMQVEHVRALHDAARIPLPKALAKEGFCVRVKGST